MEAVAIGVGVLLLILVKRLAQKYGFELKESEENGLLAVMTRIVLHVEEKGAKLLNANGKKVKGRDKLREAVALFSEEKPGHSEEKAVQLAHEALFINGIGATVVKPLTMRGKPPEEDNVREMAEARNGGGPV